MGGALAIYNEADADLQRNIFSSNQATGYGGAIYTQDINLTLTGNVFVGNNASIGDNIYIDTPTSFGEISFVLCPSGEADNFFCGELGIEPGFRTDCEGVVLLLNDTKCDVGH